MDKQDMDKHDMDTQDSLCCTVEAYIYLILRFIPLIKAIYLEILLVLQLNQVFYNGNMGESPRNEVLMIKNRIHMKHESIWFLHLFFCFKINIRFYHEFV